AYTPNVLFVDSLFTHALPSFSRLSHLTVHLLQEETASRPTQDLLTGCFQSMSRELAGRLVFLKMPFTVFTERGLLDLLRTVSFGCLEELDVRVQVLSMGLFDGLQANLGGLRRLTTCIAQVSDKADSDERDVSSRF